MKKNMLALFALFLAALLFVSCSNSAGGGAEPFPSKSDWLFLLYFDADDDVLNDDLYGNVREMEYALSQMRNADGTPKANYPSVTALVLWDGISVEKREKQKYLHPDGALYELAADYNLDYTINSGENKYKIGSVHLKGKDNLGDKFIVGAKTIDRTAQAMAEGSLDVEPNMADCKTLERFLKWAKKRYDATNVVLCLDDHGSGAYKETYTDSTAVSKTLCTDSTNGGERMLTCQNVKDALTAAGYVGSQKLKVLINDVCLHSSADALLKLLQHGDDNLIVYAWAGKMARAENIPTWGDITANQLYLTGGKDFISNQPVTVERSEDVYGLTIASSAVYPDTKDDILPNYYNWAAFSSKWGDVIKAWKAYY